MIGERACKGRRWQVALQALCCSARQCVPGRAPGLHANAPRRAASPPRCRLGTAVGAASGAPASPADQAQLAAPKDTAAAVDAQLAGIQAFVDTRVAACCEAAGVKPAATAAAASSGKLDAAAEAEAAAVEAVRSEAEVAGLLPMPAGAGDADLDLIWAALEVTFKTVSAGGAGANGAHACSRAAAPREGRAAGGENPCGCWPAARKPTPQPPPPPCLPARQARLEPPLPLLCSQPGSSVAKFARLKQELARLQQASAVLGRGQAACLSALRAADAGPAPTAAAADALRRALAHASALSAAACAGAAQALAHMPALAPCSGAALLWRPLPAGSWAAARAELAAAARQVAAAYQQAFRQEGLDFALGLHVEGVSSDVGFGRLLTSGALSLPGMHRSSCQPPSRLLTPAATLAPAPPAAPRPALHGT